ncbi:MAG: ribonuclease activity regulator RraA, partial [Chloroflexota bacterium]
MTNTPVSSTVPFKLPRPDITLPQHGAPFQRPDPLLIQQLHGVSSATASATLHKMGIRQTFIEGPKSALPGKKIVGSAVTLQFMPQREDVASGIAQEYSEKYSALWAVLETIQADDVLVIQAYGDPYTGCLGEMLITYFKARGGVGIVADGYIRDWPHVREIDLPLWVRGFTPNYASQSTLFPWAYNVPIACSRVLVLPGDIVIADDDGAVLIPRQLAPEIARQTLEHEDWEAFSRMKMQEGGSLLKYYPLNA